MSYRDELGRELTRVGISGRLRARIVDEFQDHLECDPKADLGSPPELADQFANELGTSRARRAAVFAVVALVLAGLAFALAFVLVPGRFFAGYSIRSGHLTGIVAAAAALAPQLAFATGVLAAARAFRRRHDPVIPAAEARIVMRRVTISLLAGMVSMLALALLAHDKRGAVAGWWVTLAEIAAGVGLAALLAATPAVLSAARLRPIAPGAAGDLSDDLGALLPPPLRGRPWRFALLVAGALLVFFTVTGFLASDGPDGVLRGLLEGLACLIGFATVGRYVGLWQPDSGADVPAQG